MSKCFHMLVITCTRLDREVELDWTKLDEVRKRIFPKDITCHDMSHEYSAKLTVLWALLRFKITFGIVPSVTTSCGFEWWSFIPLTIMQLVISLPFLHSYLFCCQVLYNLFFLASGLLFRGVWVASSGKHFQNNALHCSIGSLLCSVSYTTSRVHSCNTTKPHNTL
jgi:hypothetical protein